MSSLENENVLVQFEESDYLLLGARAASPARAEQCF